MLHTFLHRNARSIQSRSLEQIKSGVKQGKKSLKEIYIAAYKKFTKLKQIFMTKHKFIIPLSVTSTKTQSLVRIQETNLRQHIPITQICSRK